MKKVLSIMLILMQIVSVSFMFTDTSYALTEDELISLDLYNKSKDELQAKVNGSYVISDSEILEYLNVIGGLPLTSNGKSLNPTTFRNYKVVAYGNPYGDKFETFKVDPNMKTIEYRYLGYNKEGFEISNDQFANDFSTSSIPSSRNYQTNNEATRSWNILKTDIAQNYKLLQENVLNDDIRTNDYQPTNYSVSNLLGGKIGEYRNYVQLMLQPTYLQEGVLRLWHKGKKGIYYDTMRTTPIDNMTLSAGITVDKPTIQFLPTDTGGQTLNLTVKSNVGIYPNYGQNETRYIKKITQTISESTNGFSVDVFKNEDLAIDRPLLASDITYTIPINIPSNMIKEGETKTFTFKAKTHVTTAYDNTYVSDTATFDVVVTKGVYVPPEIADVDFKIFIDGVDYTDSSYKVSDLSFNKPVDVTLKDASTLTNIKPKYYYWFNGKTSEVIKAGDSGLNELKITINKSNKSSYLDENNDLSFDLKITGDNGIDYDSKGHKVNMLYIPTPVKEEPHSVLFAQTRTQRQFDEITVAVGEAVSLNGSRSYTKDASATINSYNFILDGFTKVTETNKNKKGYFDKEGSYLQKLTVTDSKGQTSGESQVTVNVQKPIFNLKINYFGTLKENRKLTFVIDKANVPVYYPLDFSTIRWQIIPLEGGKYISGETGGSDVIDTQFLKKGKYKIKVTGSIKSKNPLNKITYTSSDEIVVNIEEDKEPVVQFAVNKYGVRDPEEGNKVSVTVIDKSYSPDGDILEKGRLTYRYDSDNDGDYDEESEVLVSESFDEKTELIMDKNIVGKFKFNLERKEIPGQSYFQWKDEYTKWGNSDSTMDQKDKVLDILNVGPTVVFDVQYAKTINYIIATDYEGDSLLKLNSELEKLRVQLLEKKIKPNFIFYRDKTKVGEKTETKYRFIQKGHFNYVCDYGSSTSYRPNSLRTNDIDWLTIDLWESEIDKLPKLKSDGSFIKKEETHNYGDGYEQIYQHYILKGAGKEMNFDFKSHSYNDRSGNYNTQDNIRDVKFYLDSSYVKEPLETSKRELYSIDFNNLKTELGKYDNTVLLIVQNNSYATTLLKDDFVDYTKKKDIPVYTNIENMRNPAGIDEIKDFYKVYNQNIYYLEMAGGDIYKYDPTLGMSLKEESIPTNAIGTINHSFSDRVDEIGGSSQFYGPNINRIVPYIYKSDDANAIANEYRYMNYLPYKYNPFIINGKMYLRTMGLDYLYREKTVFIQSKNHLLSSDAVKILGYCPQSIDLNLDGRVTYSTYVIYKNSKGEIRRSKYIVSSFSMDFGFNYTMPTPDDKLLDIPVDYVMSNVLVDDKNKKVYSFEGQLLTEFEERTDSWIKTTRPNMYIFQGKYVSGLDQSTINGYSYMYDDHYKINYDVVYRVYNGTNYSYHYSKDVQRDSMSHFLQLDGGALISNSNSVTMVRYEVKTGENAVFNILSSAVKKIEGTIDFGDLIKAGSKNSVVKEIEELPDLISKNTDAPYLNKTVYLLLGDSLESSMLYADYENDPIKDIRFDFTHDESVFENSLGTDPSSGEGLKEPITRFNYTGLYTGKLKVWDKPNLEGYSKENNDNTDLKIYVHRKPVAKGKVTIKESGSGYLITMMDTGSYDLDAMSKKDKGITGWSWYVQDMKLGTSSTFEGKTMSLNKDGDVHYKITLKVKDMLGQWSDSVVFDITQEDVGEIQLTYDLETTDKRFGINGLPASESLVIKNINTVYDKPLSLDIYHENRDGGRTLIKTFGDSESTGEVSWDEVSYITDKKSIDGQYSIVVVARDKSKDSRFTELEKEYFISTPINLKPQVPSEIQVGESFSITANASVYTDDVELIVTDVKGNKLLTQNMNLSTKTDISKKFSTTWKLTDEVFNKLSDGDGSGIYKLNFSFTGKIKTDPEKSQMIQLKSTVNSMSIEDIKIYGEWNKWDGGKDLFGKTKDKNPRRFLSYEKMYVEVRTSGNPDSVEMSLSDELQAMRFTDDKGNVYKYKDFVGKEIKFPLKLKKISDNLYRIEYILPLAKSTLSTENKRLRDPYQITITCRKSSSTVEKKIDKNSKGGGIEITGNVYDHMYLQKK